MSIFRCCFILCLFMLIAGERGQGQQTKPCTGVTFQNDNMVDPPRLTLQTIRGSVQDIRGVSIPHACLAIFRKSSQVEIVASTETDDNGLFSFPALAPGDYTLVVTYNHLCPANLRIRIVRHTWRSHLLRAHMKPHALDDCSYVDFKRSTVAGSVDQQ